jgi:uncharacterized protein (DUF2342 family)
MVYKQTPNKQMVHGLRKIAALMAPSASSLASTGSAQVACTVMSAMRQLLALSNVGVHAFAPNTKRKVRAGLNVLPQNKR